MPESVGTEVARCLRANEQMPHIEQVEELDWQAASEDQRRFSSVPEWAFFVIVCLLSVLAVALATIFVPSSDMYTP